MAEGKYKKWLEPDGLLLLEAWARDGLTDEQISDKIDISRSTLSDWKAKYSDISDALKRGKEVVDVEVENALLKKALGIKETVLKPIKVKEVLYEDGKRLKETERIEYAEEQIYVPPETAAIIFWLKNRRPDLWRDKQSMELSGEVKNNPFAGLTTDQLIKLADAGDSD